MFEISDTDLDRYIRRKSTGEIGWITRDPGNGWLHPSMKYEWQYARDDFEYVCVNGIATAIQAGHPPSETPHRERRRIIR